MVRKQLLTAVALLAAASLAQAITIQVKRGPAATVPAKLKMGELGATTDTQRGFMGFSTSKKEFAFRDATFAHLSSAAMSGGGGTVNGILKGNGSGTVSAAVAGTDYLTPSGSGASLTALNASNLSTGTVAAARGGAGTVSGLLKANGSGTVSAAVAGTDYVAPAGNAATATALQTARTINGVSFNGTANITVADSTKEASLGNPAANGYVLSSTTAGVRSWVAQAGGTLTNTYPSTSSTTAATPAFVNAAIFANSTSAFTYTLAGAANKLAKYDATDGLTATVTIPTCTGTDKLTANGSLFSCAADQTGTAGSGITSLGGLDATTQTFANDTNVTMTSATSTHTLGWTGFLAKNRGGAGADMTNVTFPASGTLLTTTGSAAGLTSFPTLNQNTTGTAAGLTAAYIDWAAGTGGASILNKPSLPSTVSCSAGNHVSSYDPATGTFTCTADATSGGATDTNAVHVNTAGEIAAVTTKATPVSGDYLLIEDSAATNAKKKIAVGTLPFQASLVSGTSIKTVGGISLLGSGDIGILGAAYGGTGNGFTLFSGPATSTKTFTLPNASATILTDNALVTGAQGGTGVNNSGKTITLGGNLTTSGAYGVTFTATSATTVTLPTTGTLATLSGSETFTNKTSTNPTINGGVYGQTTSTTIDTSAVCGATISSTGATTLTITNVTSGRYFDFKVSSSGGGTLTVATLTPTWVTGTPASITAGKASWFVCKGTGANTADCAAVKENY